LDEGLIVVHRGPYDNCDWQNMLSVRRAVVVGLILGVMPFGGRALAQSSDVELAKQLENPVAALISVPFQSNFDFRLGRQHDGFRYTLNIQPVIPIELTEYWNLISRTILPVIHQSDVVGDSSQTGLGDTVQSFFLSPKEPGWGGIIWGVGPALLLPTATDDVLGSGKFGLGPTAVLLKQEGPWTFGFLANHIWSVAGDSDRSDVSSTFLQPFLAYTTATKTTFGINTESTYDWEAEQWTVPINVTVSQLLRLGSQVISLSLGGRYYAERPSGGPDWGLRFVVTFLFPKK
jgi:hypothetical protein